MTETHGRLLHQEALGGNMIAGVRHLGSAMLARPLQQHVANIARLNIVPQPTSVLIQARMRRYPAALAEAPKAYVERVATDIRGLCQDIEAQDFPANKMRQIVALVEEGYEPTAEQKKTLHDVQFVQIPAAVTHAGALNRGVATLGQEQVVTMISEAGARYATDEAFRAASFRIGHGAVAMFGARLPDERASVAEMAMYGGSAAVYRRLRETIFNPEPGVGYVAVDRAAFDHESLLERPFEDGYQRGGADGHWGRMARSAGNTTVFEPALSVQYTLGLSPTEVAAQLGEWSTYAGPNLHYSTEPFIPPQQ